MNKYKIFFHDSKKSYDDITTKYGIVHSWITADSSFWLLRVTQTEILYSKIDPIFWPFLQQIKEKSEQEAEDKGFTLSECNKIQNRRFNRYRDVSPYDHSRIVLHRGDVDYINANLVRMEKANRKYILTQGPLQSTVGHFWLMVWEQNSTAILMLNKIIEKKQIKCHQYWPARIGPEHRMQLNDVGLSVEYLKCEQFTNYSRRTFRLIDTESTKSREVIQFHYTTWPDFYIPTSPIAFLQFLKKVRDSGALNADVGPAVVHCSAGIGRSGTFCLVDTCLVLVIISAVHWAKKHWLNVFHPFQIEKEGENRVSVSELLVELRQSRMGLIQTADQLFFSYQAIIEGIKHLNDPVRGIRHCSRKCIFIENNVPIRIAVIQRIWRSSCCFIRRWKRNRRSPAAVATSSHRVAQSKPAAINSSKRERPRISANGSS